ncbi:hypothetical protein Y032_0090g2395 [Ancylostoma ceylanicum]|uniref:PDZ domain-containing protein n=2 Tax=Ancylostoma ceylanicum TaxID=53326 RepID=A0A016TN54_9BILA|nr:hypothetical protein Y032_0090g2395 [Ancylostoma ceylanicum]
MTYWSMFSWLATASIGFQGSPADLGGLRMGDRIFAVNGHSIIGESHKKVVERIKENAIRCEMLVISEEGAQWYQEHGIEINMQLPNIQKVGAQVSRRGTQANGSPPPAAGWYAPSNKKDMHCQFDLD